MAQTLVGTDESGAGVETGLADTTAVILRGRKKCQDRQHMAVIVHAAATGAFRLNYLFTTDGGTSWFIGKQVASAAVTVDGGTASYVAAALLDVPIGYEFKIELYNIAGSPINYAFEYRLYTQS